MALSQLNPQIIGAEMEHGFAGSYARQPDMIVVTRPVGEKEPLPFGMALMYDANGAVVLMQGSGVTADRFAGVAGREMRSALSYTDQNTGAYTTGDAGSVFQRGSINVLCQKGTPKRGAQCTCASSRTLRSPMLSWAALRPRQTAPAPTP